MAKLFALDALFSVKSFWKLIKSNQILIVITLSRLIWHQTEFGLLCQINRKSVIAIEIWFDLIGFIKKIFPTCTVPYKYIFLLLFLSWNQFVFMCHNKKSVWEGDVATDERWLGKLVESLQERWSKYFGTRWNDTKRWEMLTLAFREADVSWHNRGPVKGLT